MGNNHTGEQIPTKFPSLPSERNLIIKSYLVAIPSGMLGNKSTISNPLLNRSTFYSHFKILVGENANLRLCSLFFTVICVIDVIENSYQVAIPS